MVFKLSFSSLRVRTDVEALYLKQGAGRPVRRKPRLADLSSTTDHSPRLCLPPSPGLSPHKWKDWAPWSPRSLWLHDSLRP